ncbi:hypothetical protein BST81_15205 [Leptolyngbya sp. 'hensonii']|uniref:hypothetical protein n=1 Tax=Leptolyngbya sp. 'hensonii' TaxID=1922337 RepID=UPI00094FCE1C|nr:hypothetical protein [Leptolyngbya sp. 'hensonii']OLP17665.1 hypothetical protein BST81_15205 [Leptolyngbya sp. 'hensonii']
MSKNLGRIKKTASVATPLEQQLDLGLHEPEQQEEQILSFRDLGLQKKYSTYRDNPYTEFYLPVLGHAVQYDRKSGHFSSANLSRVAQGLELLLDHPGKMRLLMSYPFNDRDYREIVGAYKQYHGSRAAKKSTKSSQEETLDETCLDTAQALLVENLLKTLQEPENSFQEDQLKILGLLVKQNRLDIRIAIPVSPDGFLNPSYDQFHEKVGIFTDGVGNKIAFNGSNNEALAGWERNLESFHVFCNWKRGDQERVQTEVKDFEEMWTNKLYEIVLVLELPDAVCQRLMAYAETPPEPPEPLLESPPRRSMRQVHKMVR